MTQKWNLQDIRPVEPRKRKPASRLPQGDLNMSSSKPLLTERENIPNIIIEDGAKKARGRVVLSIVLFVLIVGGAIGLSALLGKTELTIYPENRSPNVNAEFTAYPDKRNGELSYEIMTLEATSESQVKATGQIEVSEQAEGLIEIIKKTPGAERLIKNTRFRTQTGLVYRIKESVVVPGSITDGTGVSIPGTIQAEVFADEPGEKYNIPANETFDVPGFKEGGFTDLYSSISARNVQPFTGGFQGPQFKIDEGELQTARQALQIELRNNLLARVQTEKPAEFIAFNDAVAIVYNELPAVQYGEDLVTIREQAVLQIPLFNIGEFGSFLAKETITTYDGGTVRIDNPDTLSFSYTSPTTSITTLANETSLTFKIVGKPQLIWEYDASKLTMDLVGLPKTAINNAITAYPGIVRARVHITPFWKRTFPEDPNEIIIIEEIEEMK